MINLLQLLGIFVIWAFWMAAGTTLCLNLYNLCMRENAIKDNVELLKETEEFMTLKENGDIEFDLYDTDERTVNGLEESEDTVKLEGTIDTFHEQSSEYEASGAYNIVIGYHAGEQMTTGSYSTMLGDKAVENSLFEVEIYILDKVDGLKAEDKLYINYTIPANSAEDAYKETLKFYNINEKTTACYGKVKNLSKYPEQ